MKECMYYDNVRNGVVVCKLCPKQCTIKPGCLGICRVRENHDGKLYSVNHTRVSACALDPVEKKPLRHFIPGSKVLSVGSWGCNLHCKYCQNWQLAHGIPETEDMSPEKTVALALELKDRGDNCIGIAYTYSEPLMRYEYVYETAVLAREAGLKNVLVTNGYINEEPLRQLLPYIDAMNIDVKSFSNNFYWETCLGTLEPVKQTVEIAQKYCHVEISTLLVSGLNDSDTEIQNLVNWLEGINKDIPLHLNRYYPNYKMQLAPTPVKTLERARDIAKSRLSSVYVGNIG